MARKFRIVSEWFGDGSVEYHIQYKDFLFWEYTEETHITYTLEDAKRMLEDEVKSYLRYKLIKRRVEND